MTNIKRLQEDIANAKIKTPEKSVEEIVDKLFDEKYDAKDILVNNWDYFLEIETFTTCGGISDWIIRTITREEEIKYGEYI